MEAGKQRLSRDTPRDATRLEINALKRESADLQVSGQAITGSSSSDKTSAPSLHEGVANA